MEGYCSFVTEKNSFSFSNSEYKFRGRDVLLAPFCMAIPDQEEPSSSSRHPPALCPLLFTMAERLKLFMAFVLGGMLLFF